MSGLSYVQVDPHGITIVKTKSNFTRLTTEYIFTVFDLTKLDIAMSCWYAPYPNLRKTT